MTFVAAVLAQLLHLALMLVAAPFVAGLGRRVEALLGARSAPDFRQSWRDLHALIRKQPVTAENTSPLSRAVPTACFAAMVVAVALVPSFTLGMLFAPCSDLLVLLGLLGFARVALALAALEPGTALAGLAASRTAMLACLAEPAVFMAILALGWLGGTTNLDLLIGLQRQGMLQPLAAVVLAGGALATLALATPDATDLTGEFNGADLALLHLAEALRRLVWLDLLAGLVLPFGMAEAGGGLSAWIVGLLAWAGKLAVLTAALALLRGTLGTLRPAWRPQAIGIATALGVLAALLVLASAVSA